jgi:hypothetical protein
VLSAAVVRRLSTEGRGNGTGFEQVHSICSGIAPVPEVLHRLLNALAWLVRWRLLPSLSALAGLIDWFSNHLRWGEHRGGMFVQLFPRA